MNSAAAPIRSRIIFSVTLAVITMVMAFLALSTQAHGQVAPLPPPPPPPDSVAPEIEVTKDASVASVEASGTSVTFTVTIANVGSVSANISEIDDDQFGNLLDPANAAVENNTCVDLAGDTVPVDGSASCTFDAPVRGECDTTHTNEVTVRVYSDRQFPDTASDTADVEITCPTPTTTSTPEPTPETTPSDPTDGDDPTPETEDPELTATADPPTPATTGMGVSDSDDGFATEASWLAGMLLVVVTGSLVVRAQRRRN